MGLMPIFVSTPAPPPVGDRTDNGLPALVHRHALHIDALLALLR